MSLQQNIKGSVITDAHQLAAVQTDKSYLTGCCPAVLVLPSCPEDVPICLQFAREHSMPVTVQGARSGKSGGAIPLTGGMALSFENMTAIIDIDVANRCVVLEPGVVVDTLKTAVAAQGLWYPPDPASSDWCTIGGTVAENAGGPNALAYGVTGDYILGVSGYLMTGEPFSFGGKCHKNVSGYNMTALLVGSEGTLGVITKIIVKLRPKPAYQSSCVCVCQSTEQACTLLQTLSTAAIPVTAAEFLDPRCLAASARYLGVTVPEPLGPTVLFRFVAETQAGLDRIAAAITTTAQAQQARCQQTHAALYWRCRQATSEALASQYQAKFSEDITVPPAKIAAFLKAIAALESEHIHLLGYGHLGDGNIHTNILNVACPMSQWPTEKGRLCDAIMAIALELGGTLSGEHGIGLTKKKYMSHCFSATEIRLMKAIKKSFDPQGLLNPDKLFA